MKRFTLLTFAMLLITIGVKAKTTETTLWEDEYSGSIELNQETVSTFNVGDVLRIYVSVPESGANFKICYKGDGNGWTETAIPSINNQWPWVNGGDSKCDITLTSDDITALNGMNIYISKGENSTISKVSKLTEEAEEEGTPSELWIGEKALGNWSDFEDLRYEGKGSLANAKIGDDIRITFTFAQEGCQLYVCDAASYVEFDGAYYEPSASDDAQTLSYRITNASILEIIQQKGIVLKGKLATLTKVELVTYATSYDAASVTIGEDGIATYSSSKSLDFAGTGITVYYASSVSTGVVNLTPVGTTWGYQGYIVRDAAGTYDVPVTDRADYPSPNYLKATSDYAQDLSASTDGEFRYIFAKDEILGIGFYKLGTSYNLVAHRAYLETTEDITPISSEARITLRFSDDITGIQEVSEAKSQNDGIYYNMNGQRISKPTNGMYIVNGKKYAAK